MREPDIITTSGNDEKRTYRIVVSLVFGLVGFCLNFYPLDVLIPPHKASFVWGLVFPMLISLSWGWRYGLLSATLGLGGQTMWFLWLPVNGWAPFVSIPLYTLWIVYHGWRAGKKKGLLSSWYAAEVPFRIFGSILHLSLFPWVFQFNPSPWAPRMVMTSAPQAFVNFVVFKLIIEGLMILLLADVLLSFAVIRKILLIEERENEKAGPIISGALFLGLVFWIASAVIDFALHGVIHDFLDSTPSPTLADVMILQVPPHELFRRVLFIIVCLVAGLVISKYFVRHKKSEAALAESEDRYKTLVENVDIGITLIGPEHRVIMTNKAAADMLHKQPDDIVEKYCYREFEKKEEICAHCPGVEALRTGRAAQTITTGVRDDGTRFTVSIKAFPLTRGRHAGGFIEVVEDITEKVKMDEKLAAEKERLAVTLRSIGDGVITTDVEGRIVLINKIAEDLTGWSHEEAVGRTLQDVFRIINEQTREACESPVQKVLATGKIVGLANHTVLIGKDGRELIITDSGAPIRDWESNIIGVVLVFRDITEQLRTANELLKVKKLESLGVLAGGIAHDFNNILAAILGNISLSLLDQNLRPETRNQLTAAEKALLRARGLTQQLLTFSKGGAPVKETSSLHDVIRDSAGFVLHGDKVKCRYSIPDDLWLVDVDKGQISQVIQNVVLNASQAMPKGGHVLIKCENIHLEEEESVLFSRGGNFVKITITDTGKGIAPDVLGRIFDPYFSTKQEGSGLGLAITHSIITKHNGRIEVDSEPGAGTTFTIHLPAAPEGKKEASVQSMTDVVHRDNKARILIMDDEEMVLDVTSAMLDALGHETVAARDGDECIRLYREAMESGSPIDLAILDLTIPGGMGGKETVREILKINPKARVVVSSGYSNDPIMAAHREYGFCAAVVKPYLIQELSRVITKVFREHAAETGQSGP